MTVTILRDKAASMVCGCGAWVVPASIVHMFKDDCMECGETVGKRYARAPLGIEAFWRVEDTGPFYGPFETEKAARKAHREGSK